MMNILVVGNPGAGKSTILNTLLQKAQFKSGASLGVGLTFRFDKFQENGITYMDTPGLCDIERRKQAAEAITMALKQNGIYKVFFVATLEQGRLRPDDVALLKMILESATELTNYYVVINQVSRAIKKNLKLDNKAIDQILLNSAISKQNLPHNTLIVDRVDEIEGESNKFMDRANMEALKVFVDNAKGVRIHSHLVTNIAAESFDEIRSKMETEMQKMKKKNTDIEKRMANLLNEREQERIKEESKRLLLEKEKKEMQIIAQQEREKNAKQFEKLQREMSGTIFLTA